MWEGSDDLARRLLDDWRITSSPFSADFEPPPSISGKKVKPSREHPHPLAPPPEPASSALFPPISLSSGLLPPRSALLSTSSERRLLTLLSGSVSRSFPAPLHPPFPGCVLLPALRLFGASPPLLDLPFSVSPPKVLELGCGHGLPGVLAAVSGAAEVHFADFNAEVLSTLTAFNVRQNLMRLPKGRSPLYPFPSPLSALPDSGTANTRNPSQVALCQLEQSRRHPSPLPPSPGYSVDGPRYELSRASGSKRLPGECLSPQMLPPFLVRALGA